MSYPVRLSKEGLFFVLGKLYYAESLINAKFEGEDDLPIGADEALNQLEEAKEPLLLLVIGPPDTREEFVAYLAETYEIALNLDFAVSVESPLTTTGTHLTIVPDDETPP